MEDDLSINPIYKVKIWDGEEKTPLGEERGL
jgi:hypothetical protein